jgi:hypothetical protein
MSRFGNALVVDSLWFMRALAGSLFAAKKILILVGGINRHFIPTKTILINSLSPARFMNNSSVNFDFSSLSTRPIRAITKYLNNLLLISAEEKQ